MLRSKVRILLRVLLKKRSRKIVLILDLFFFILQYQNYKEQGNLRKENNTMFNVENWEENIQAYYRDENGDYHIIEE